MLCLLNEIIINTFLPKTYLAEVAFSTLGGCGNADCSMGLQLSTSNSGCQRIIFSLRMTIGSSNFSKNCSCSVLTLSTIDR